MPERRWWRDWILESSGRWQELALTLLLEYEILLLLAVLSENECHTTQTSKGAYDVGEGWYQIYKSTNEKLVSNGPTFGILHGRRTSRRDNGTGPENPLWLPAVSEVLACRYGCCVLCVVPAVLCSVCSFSGWAGWVPDYGRLFFTILKKRTFYSATVIHTEHIL